MKMSSPEITPQPTLIDIVSNAYESLDQHLHTVFTARQTFENEALLDPGVHSLTIYNTIRDVTEAHSLCCSEDINTAQKAAFEAFWFAVQIASVLPNKPKFHPGNYFKLPPEELYTKMAEDALYYLEDKPYISTLIGEHVDVIDPSGTHTVMIESFAAVAIMLIDQSICGESNTNEDVELEKEFARLLLYVNDELPS